MLPGFNTNVRHRGVLFHVQSEDSGRAHPHIITHLYHGGTILFSEKSSYAELVDAPDLAARVRERMEAQHRAVLGRLRAGGFDEAIRKRLGPVLDDADTRASTRPTATAPIEETTEPPARLPASDGAPRTEPTPAAAPEAARAFGEGIVSAKPLDEVILEYLVENARKRRQKPTS
jgi:hypothetical protein